MLGRNICLVLKVARHLTVNMVRTIAMDGQTKGIHGLRMLNNTAGNSHAEVEE